MLENKGRDRHARRDGRANGYTLLVGNTSVLAVIPSATASAGYDPAKNVAPDPRGAFLFARNTAAACAVNLE